MKIGIYGYGNLGRAAEILSSDFGITVSAVFTRRDPDSVRTLRAPIYSRRQAADFKNEIDCMLLCGSSLGDVREDAFEIAKHYNTVDAFDIHSEIKGYKSRLDAVAKRSGHSSVVASGWDPGVLSIFRAYFSSIMPRGEVNTFWGRGVSQGHSEVIRGISGVKRAVEYTVPSVDALSLARSGKTVDKYKRHTRECYVVADACDHERIEQTIKAIAEYYSGYDTDVHFIDEAAFMKSHLSMPHKGECIAFNMSGFYREHISRAELNISMDSNPEFTASAMLAYAAACDKLSREARYGAFDVLDIPMRYLLCDDRADKLI